MTRLLIDHCNAPDPYADALDFVLDPIEASLAIQAKNEQIARRRYAEMMRDAQFGPGAILDLEA